MPRVPDAKPPSSKQKGRHKDLTGLQFGKWKVLELAGLDKARRSLWRVCCVCGNIATVSGFELICGHSTKCKLCSGVGVILHGHTIGKAPSPLYKTWRGMKERCYNPNHKSYRYYGARGVGIWPQWRESFATFAMYVLNTIGPRPTNKTLDRINPDLGYVPANLRWATAKEQRLNRSSTGEKHHTTVLNQDFSDSVLTGPSNRPQPSSSRQDWVGFLDIIQRVS